MSSSNEVPISIEDIAYGFMASQALFAALELGLFDAIHNSKEKPTVKDIQKALKIDAPRLQTLLTALTSTKLIHRDNNGRYTLHSSTTSFLVRSSKHFYGDYLRLQVGRQFYTHMADLGKTVSTGTGPTYETWFNNAKEARQYTLAQHNGSMATARQLLKKVNCDVGCVADIGGGSGAFSIAMAMRYKNLRSTILELPKVAETGAEIVSQYGASVAARVTYESGTALTAWGLPESSHDLVLMSYLSGSVPCDMLLPMYQQAYRVLKPNGRLVVHDFMVDDDLQGPKSAALWALQHVAVNTEGLGLCPSNVSRVVKEAGFETVDAAFDLIHGLTKVVVATKLSNGTAAKL